ncbi:Type-1 restriction enzyme EcoKI specificity protein [termite gut metagenome]|uniref:Type-1 restriction enzyme EcoKI specificity protein n=1 Tax=termite gut metagenome TaxID=433724 RepID=A0A5J4PSU4_9ZZZZ
MPKPYSNILFKSPPDILFARTGATVGKSYIISNIKEKAIFASYLIRVKVANSLNAQYVKLFFDTSFYWGQITNKSVGTGQPNVNEALLQELILPIPTVDEQAKIVSEIKPFFTLIDEIEENKLSLEQFIKQTKSKVLDLAIRGKLVPQDPNDEPISVLLEKIKNEQKKAGKKMEMASDISHYKPFEIPKSWVWCKLGDVFQITMGQSPEGTSVTYNDSGVEFHQGKVNFGEMYLENSNLYTHKPTRIAEANSLLLCVRAPVGILNITTRKICIGRGLCAIQTLNKMNLIFAFHWLRTLENTFNLKATGSTFTAISSDIINSCYAVL